MNDLFPAFGSQNTTTQFGANSGWFLDITDLSLVHVQQRLKFTIRVYSTLCQFEAVFLPLLLPLYSE